MVQKSTATRAHSKPEVPEVQSGDEISVKCKIAYPELTEQNDNGVYQILGIVEPDSESAAKLKALVRANLETLYPNGIPKAGYWNPIRSGDELKGDGELAFKDEAFRGQLVFRAKTKFQPKVYRGAHRDQAEASLPRSGDHAILAITAYAYRNASTGVGLSLNSVWWVKPGERPIGGAGKGGSSFSTVNTADIDFYEE